MVLAIILILIAVILFIIRNSEVGQLMAAKQHMEQGNYDQARLIYESVIEKD